MNALGPLIPILTAAGIILAGNGLQGTLIAIRGVSEGFSPSMIGLIGTTYFAGFLIGCLFVGRMLRSVGHIRVFASLAALAASGTLLLVLVIDPFIWMGIRFLVGFCFAGLFTTMESWINSAVDNRSRGRVLAIYRIVDLVSVTLSQFMIPFIGPGGFTIFAAMAIMITLSLVPVSLGDRSNPEAPKEISLDLGRVWQISPLACMGAAVAGLSNAAFRLIGPLYAEGIGLAVSDIAIFISLGVIGGVVLQYPLGSLSDRWDRRKVLMITSAGAMVTALIFGLANTPDRFANFLLVTLSAAFAMPVYSIAAAHGNDNAGQGEFVRIAAALMLFYSLGAVIGPVASSFIIEKWGFAALFHYSAGVYALFIAATIYRMRARESVPREARGRFIALLRTSPIFAALSSGRNTKPDGEEMRKKDCNEP